jgi:LmbE family N-acetylglucosaminyl deacetylase
MSISKLSETELVSNYYNTPQESPDNMYNNQDNRLQNQGDPMPVAQRRVLAIGAHPDDLEIGCGATLAKMHKAGYILMGLVLTQGEQGGDIHCRITQTREAAKLIGLNYLRICQFQDTYLARQEMEVYHTIEECILEFKPDIILTHSEHDLHQDHVAAHNATLRAGRNIHSILCYESPEVTYKFIPTFFIAVDRFAEIKLQSIQLHRDQNQKHYTKPTQIYGKMVFRGGQAKVNLAEGFEAIRILSSNLGGI